MDKLPFIVLPGAAGVLSVVSFKYSNYPFLWMAAGWLVCFSGCGVFSRKPIAKAVLYNIAFVCLLVGAFEAYAAMALHAKQAAKRSGPQLQTTRSKDYTDPHPILGYAARPNSHSTVQLSFGEKIIYNVSYNFDAYGLRVSPPSLNGPCEECVLFFGGSFTLGEGVEDAEALPYQVGLKSRCPVYNFGFRGYGPHHMLAAIEKGMLVDIVDCRPQAVIYQAILDHVSRVAGLSSWGADTPRYRIAADGSVQHTGRFSDINGPADRIREAFKRTHIYRKFVHNRIRADIDDIELLIAVVAAAEQKLKAMYPGIAFHIILWDKAYDKKRKQKLYEQLYSGLARKGFQIHLASQILSGYPQTRADYELSSQDNHPNARAYREMAVYINRNILEDHR